MNRPLPIEVGVSFGIFHCERQPQTLRQIPRRYEPAAYTLGL